MKLSTLKWFILVPAAIFSITLGYKHRVPADTPVSNNIPILGVICKTDNTKNLHEKLETCGIADRDKAAFAGQEIAKIGPKARITRGDREIQIVSMTPFDNGVEVYIRAWDSNGQIGFGKDKDVDIERVRLVDPDILVPDPLGDVSFSYTNPFTKEIETVTYRVDPEEALYRELELAVRRKTSGTPVTLGSVGRTTTIQPASQDNFMDSENPATNNSSDATLSLGDASTASSQDTVSTLTFDVAGNVTAGHTVTSATLSLFEYQAGKSGAGNQTTLTVRRILRNWVNAQETFNQYSTGNNWTTGGARGNGTDRSSTDSATLAIDSTAAGTFIDITGTQLTSDVQDMLDNSASNFGWGLYSDGSSPGVLDYSYNFFRSSNYATAGDRPKLVIESSPPATPAAGINLKINNGGIVIDNGGLVIH